MTNEQFEKIIELLEKIESNTSDIARDVYDIDKIRNNVATIKEILENKD